MNPIKTFFTSKVVRWVISGIGILIVALLIFHAGAVVGSRRGPFNIPFDGPGAMMEHRFRPPFLPTDIEFPHGFMRASHGAIGEITSVTTASSTFTVKTRDGSIRTVSITPSTLIKSDIGTSTEAGSLSSGMQVIILGEPNVEDTIDARVIRILPPPPINIPTP